MVKSCIELCLEEISISDSVAATTVVQRAHTAAGIGRKLTFQLLVLIGFNISDLKWK
jgi:hypothetical protein